MCNSKDAERLIREAKRIEQDDPQKAKQNYLEAAEVMLFLSTQDCEQQERYVQFAHKLQHQANTVASPPEITPQSFDPQPETSCITFQDIGGLDQVKEEIRFKIIEPLLHPDLFTFYNKKTGGGILMYGPPGCGKTLIAEAAANEAQATFFHVKSSDLKSKYVGETEKNIAELFEKARKHQPSIIFFDEFESLGADRSASYHAHEVSAVAQLLTEMDGMGTKDQQILVIGATNEPWSVDPALRREGRLGQTIFIPPPDLRSRKDILEVHMRERPTQSIDFTKLAALTEHYSGADLKALCESATDIPLKEYFRTKQQRPIVMDDFLEAKEKVQSIIIPWFRKAEQVVKDKRMEHAFTHLLDFTAHLPATV